MVESRPCELALAIIRTHILTHANQDVCAIDHTHIVFLEHLLITSISDVTIWNGIGHYLFSIIYTQISLLKTILMNVALLSHCFLSDLYMHMQNMS